MHQPVDFLHEIVEVCSVLSETCRLLQAVKVVVKHVHQHRFAAANSAPGVKLRCYIILVIGLTTLSSWARLFLAVEFNRQST